MKKSILFLSLIILTVNLFSQICKSGNEWNYLKIMIPTCSDAINCSGVFYEVNHYKVGRDTVINAKTYKTILLSVENLNGKFDYQPAGFLREEENGKKVYSLSSQNEDYFEILLYDFTIQKDSVFESTYPYSYYSNHIKYTFTDTYFKSKVTNIDSIEYEGKKRLRIQFDNYAYSGTEMPSESYSWIEGIGSTQELLRYPNSYGNILLCFQQNEEMNYLNNYGYDCDYKIIDNIKIPNNNKHNFLISTNVEAEVLIKSNDESVLINELSVYNLQGLLLLSYSPKSSIYTINSLNLGVYLLKINNEFHKLIIP